MAAKKITIKEIANMLNVSSTTVSRVLNGNAKKYRISEMTQQRVLAAARAHNFQPNQVARDLRLQKTNTVGLVIPDISNPYFANLARTTEIILRKAGKMILLCDTHDDPKVEAESLLLLTRRKVDGLLLAPVGESADHLQAYLDLPMVMVDRYFPSLTIPYVATDNEQGARLATEYLLARGHQQIVCIQGLEKALPNLKRVKGFVETMQESGRRTGRVLGDRFTVENGYQVMKQLLAEPELPDAIFTLSNQIAIGVMHAVQEAGLSIPNDVSLITFDEQPYFQLTAPPVTTIAQPIAQIGQTAVEMLFQCMQNQPVESQLLTPVLVERASVIPR